MKKKKIKGLPLNCIQQWQYLCFLSSLCTVLSMIIFKLTVAGQHLLFCHLRLY